MDNDTPTAPAVRFDLGPIVSTPGALDALRACNADPLQYLRRHAAGDWGDLDETDKAANAAAITSGARIMSVYTLPDGQKLWVITDAEIDDQHNRQATTFLLPDEY
jgi:hypothetical protein